MSLNIENRYLNFYISVLNDKNEIPENLKFLSWNYDFQLELANKKLFPSKKSIISYPDCIENETPYNKPNFIHLNGVAGSIKTSMNEIIDLQKGTCHVDHLYKQIVNIISHEPLITFAWEERKSDSVFGTIDERIKRIKNMIEGSSILVVIGYSFPFFNRAIDMEIIGELSSTSLRKIYYQSPDTDGSQLKSQFDLNNTGIEVVPIRDCNQFFIPHEL